jgi:hypothetical protein
VHALSNLRVMNEALTGQVILIPLYLYTIFKCFYVLLNDEFRITWSINIPIKIKYKFIDYSVMTTFNVFTYTFGTRFWLTNIHIPAWNFKLSV